MRDWSTELTYKQLFFCKEYIANGGNATKAAKSAGYKELNAKQMGTENLSKPIIQEYLEELNARRNARLDADADWVVKSLQGLVAANQRLDNNGIPVDSTAANKSLELIGKTHGIFTDKKDVTVGGSFNIQWLDPSESPQLSDNTDDNGADVE